MYSFNWYLKMKQQTHDKLNVWRTRKKSEPKMGFEPTTLRDLTTELLETLWWASWYALMWQRDAVSEFMCAIHYFAV